MKSVIANGHRSSDLPRVAPVRPVARPAPVANNSAQPAWRAIVFAVLRGALRLLGYLVGAVVVIYVVAKGCQAIYS